MDLSKEQAIEIGKIAKDIFAFLPYVKIQEPGELALDYELWPHLEDFYQQLQENKMIDLIKAKQVGVSWAVAIYCLHKIYTLPGWNVLEFSKGMVESQELLSKSKIVYHNLPDWMKIYHVEPNSSERFGFSRSIWGERWGSKITALPSTETAGIGETAGTVIHDEADFHEFFKVNLSHTRATVADSPERQLIAVSTLDKTKPDSYFKQHYREAESGKNSFKSIFYPYNVRPDRDEQFYDAMKRENELTPWVVEANYPRSVGEALAPLAATSCFNSAVLEDLWDNADEGEIRQGFIHIWHPPQIGTHYVAGVDVGEGVGLDYSVLSIVGKRGLSSEVVAAIYTNTVGTDSFAYEVDRLCGEYFDPLLAVDNIGIGRAVIDKLVELGRRNLFYQDNKKGKAGWSLTRPNKRELAVKLIENINNSSLITRHPPQINEMMEYQWIKGYPEPTGKTHGDTIVALMLANMLLPKVGGVEKATMYVSGQKVW